MKKLTGTISYTLTVSEDGYHIDLPQTTQIDMLKNDLAAVCITRLMLENYIANIKRCKEENRPYFDEHFKDTFNKNRRTVEEIGEISDMVFGQLLQEHGKEIFTEENNA